MASRPIRSTQDSWHLWFPPHITKWLSPHTGWDSRQLPASNMSSRLCLLRLLFMYKSALFLPITEEGDRSPYRWLVATV